MIAKNPDERRRYESRLKMQRDEQARLEAAEERGRAIGEERGRAIGEERGRAIGRVQVLQSLAGHSESTADQLMTKSLEELAAMEQDLKQQLRGRG